MVVRVDDAMHCLMCSSDFNLFDSDHKQLDTAYVLATAVHLRPSVIQRCMRTGFNLVRRSYLHEHARLNLSQRAIYRTILRRLKT